MKLQKSLFHFFIFLQILGSRRATAKVEAVEYNHFVKGILLFVIFALRKSARRSQKVLARYMQLSIRLLLSFVSTLVVAVVP
jgi:hypothetical protein